MNTFDLPPAIKNLIAARNELREHYREVLLHQNSDIALSFTIDGNLVGDIGEAIAAELFGIKLVERKSTEAIDGYAPDGGATVQVKATGTGRGPAFRLTKTRAEHLLFFELDFENSKGAVIFNGPEHIATNLLPVNFTGQRSLTRNQIRMADKLVALQDRLPRI